VPVIQAGSADSLLGNVKSKGADQMKPTAGCSAGPGDITAVLGDFRFHQYDIQHCIFTSCSAKVAAETWHFVCFDIVCQTFRKINPKIRNMNKISYNTHKKISLGANFVEIVTLKKQRKNK
jgi:hypothetical protein